MKHVKLFEQFVNEEYYSDISRQEWTEAISEIKDTQNTLSSLNSSQIEKIERAVEKDVSRIYDNENYSTVIDLIFHSEGMRDRLIEKRLHDAAQQIEISYGTEGSMVIECIYKVSSLVFVKIKKDMSKLTEAKKDGTIQMTRGN